MRLEDFCSVNPRIQYLPEYDMKPETDWYGIKAFFYDGADYDGKKTKVFAHIGYPQMNDGEKVPAVVLVHGGGGHAFPEWIRLWNKKGFAAMAMDTTGFVPREEKKGLLGTETRTMTVDYVHELYGELEEEGYTLGPDKKDMLDYELPIEDQWMYHAVADTILAHNIFLNDEKIDSNKIGIAGISWGSVITAIAIGYDPRYAFAIPIYGGGHLDFDISPKLPTVFRKPKVKELWSAADRFDKVGYPVLWKSWLYDTVFSTGANSLSYFDTKKSGSYLSMSRKMGHSHCLAWDSVEAYRFARRIVDGKLPLIKAISAPEGFGEICFKVEIPEDFTDVKAEIVYSATPMEYAEDNTPQTAWQGIEADIANAFVKGRIPLDACCYFVELRGKVDGVEYISDTEVIYK